MYQSPNQDYLGKSVCLVLIEKSKQAHSPNDYECSYDQLKLWWYTGIKKIQGMNYKEKSNHSNAQWTDQWSCSQNIALMFGDRLENLTALHLKMATTWRQRKNYLFFFSFLFGYWDFCELQFHFYFFLLLDYTTTCVIWPETFTWNYTLKTPIIPKKKWSRWRPIVVDDPERFIDCLDSFQSVLFRTVQIVTCIFQDFCCYEFCLHN